MANILTGCRMAGSLLLLFFPVFSGRFYALYLICGLSDLLDGPIARKTNTASESGARLDTIADFIFFAVCFIKILPVLPLPLWLWVWFAAIALIKIINVISGFLCRKKLAAEHTLMNKLTGALLFLFPLTLPYIDCSLSAAILCAAATFAAVQEGHYIRTGREIS